MSDTEICPHVINAEAARDVVNDAEIEDTNFVRRSSRQAKQTEFYGV